MTAPTGVLAASTVSASGDVVRIDLDARIHRFLRDHLVDGRPLLSTVMGIETIACAVRHVRPELRIVSVTDVQVGPPYLLPRDGVGGVSVTVSGVEVTVSGVEVTTSGVKVTTSGVEMTMSGAATLRCEVRSDEAEPHFTAAVVVVATSVAVTTEATAIEQLDGPRADLPTVQVAGEVVYGLYFHGPSFRVIGSAGIDGTTAVARLSRGLPSIVEPARRPITAPLLIELCLQTAGLWDLAAGQGMTIPRRIDRVRRFSEVDSDTSTALFAVVEAGTDGSGRRFDARIVDDQGHVHLAVEGYRTTPFGHPYDTDAAARIRTRLMR